MRHPHSCSASAPPQTGGFKEWTKRDFAAFIRGSERHGRDNVAEIAKEVEGKTEEEVAAYHKVFWERWQELDDADKIYNTIRKGEERIERNQKVMSAIQRKVNRYKSPLDELKIHYGTSKGKAYNEEEDRFLICSVNELGYGRWDELKAAIRRCWRFRFDWFFKSRSVQELQRRTETLIKLIEREFEEGDGGAKVSGADDEMRQRRWGRGEQRRGEQR